jgi:hypothetical protein
MKALHRKLSTWGFDGRQLVNTASGMSSLRAERREYERQRLNNPDPEEFPITASYPFFEDRFSAAGTASGHYFHQDLFVAREIFRRNPTRHVDVGSAIYGFVSHVASFREIEVLDVRPIDDIVEGIEFHQVDLMNMTPSLIASTDSLSCLHALEHFGLGRYGDPIDYKGWKKGIDNLSLMLKDGGILYLSVPTGKTQRVEFNAHRVFSVTFLRRHLELDFELESFAFVSDDGRLHKDYDPNSLEAESSFNASYGCSIWVLRKKIDRQ